MTPVWYWAALRQAAAASPTNSLSAGGFAVTLDIAATLSALLWPLVILAVLLVYRQRIPDLLQRVLGRISKIGVGGVSIELTRAAAFTPEWSETAGALDLRHKAAAMQVNDSTAMTFRSQLIAGGPADYAEINLGNGLEWLTSRLFLMSIVFARMKSIRCLVFLESSGEARRRFVGWSSPAVVRWALARRYPWLEEAYADAYAAILTNRQGFVVNRTGRLGRQMALDDPGPSLDLIQAFLQRIQAPVPPAAAPPTEPTEWISLNAVPSAHEHASWIASGDLDELIGPDLNRSTIGIDVLKTSERSARLRAVLAESGEFAAVVAEDHRFEYLVDRGAVLEQLAGQMVASG